MYSKMVYSKRPSWVGFGTCERETKRHGPSEVEHIVHLQHLNLQIEHMFRGPTMPTHARFCGFTYAIKPTTEKRKTTPYYLAPS